MEQRRRPMPEKRPYKVNPKTGHIEKQMIHAKHHYRQEKDFSSKSKNQMVYDFKRAKAHGIKRSKHGEQYKNNITNIADYRGKNSLAKEGKATRNFSFRKMNSSVKVLGLLLILAISLIGIVFMSSTVHSLGIEISETKKELNNVQNTNQQLKQQYEELANLDRVEKIAKNELHMVEPEQTILYEPKHHVANSK